MKKRLFLIVALQIFLLLSVVAKYNYIAATGSVVTLKTAPVDPRDLFYGDYVVLNFEISEIELNQVQHDLKGELHDVTVYVLVEKKQNPWYEAVGVFQKRPTITANQAVLRAKLGYYSDSTNFEDIHLKYGVENYSVPENTGKEIEEQREALTLVDLRVLGNGEAIIDKLRFE